MAVRPIPPFFRIPDPNDRNCMTCKGLFTPYSMGPDGGDLTTPPEVYVCLSCRDKKGKAHA